MGTKITIWFESSAASLVHGWVDTDRDGKVSDEAPVHLHRSGDRWMGEAEVTATTTRGVVVVWHVDGQAGGPYAQEIVRDADGVSLLDENYTPRSGVLAGVPERILGICGV